MEREKRSSARSFWLGIIAYLIGLGRRLLAPLRLKRAIHDRAAELLDFVSELLKQFSYLIFRVHGARTGKNLLTPFHALCAAINAFGKSISLFLDKRLRRHYHLASGGEQTVEYRILIPAEHRYELRLQGQRLVKKRLPGFEALQDGERPALLPARLVVSGGFQVRILVDLQ